MMGSQLQLRFEQEAKLLKKFVAQVVFRDKRIQARENEIKNLETLLEAETDMKKIAEVKNAKLGKELENLQALFSDLQVSNDRLSQQVSALQAQVTGEEKIKAALEEFKQYEDNRVKKRRAEMDARLDVLSIDFDDELYPHMLTAIAGRRWVIGHGLHLVVMKCDESTEPSSSQLKIHVYPEVRNPTNPWAYKEDILLADSIAANVSYAEKKKKVPSGMPYIRGWLRASRQIRWCSGVRANRCSTRSRYPVGGCDYTNGDIRGQGLS
nr:hypothetical protein [Tanacetum cinerariifolium]